MGTNFYLFHPAHPITDDPWGDEGDERYGLHIGKSSVGWRFSWRAHPDRGIRSRADWETLFTEGDAAIFDEYGALVPLAEFRQRAFHEHRNPDHRLRGDLYDGDYLDLDGERFTSVPFF